MSHFGFFTCENEREKNPNKNMIKQFLKCSQEAPVKQDIAKFFLWHGEVIWLACIAGEENRRFSYTNHEIPELFSGYSYSTRVHTLSYRL